MNLQKNKDNRIRVVIVGHVDHGKSSLIGRLLYELDQIQDGKYEELKKISEKRGMKFEWAFLLDSLQTERDQGITIDKTEIFFSSKKKNYVFIDAPGHKEFLKNMITGASSADVAFLIVDVSEGIKEQTKKHGYLLKLLGINEVIVLVNKMDSVNYNRIRFINVVQDLEVFLDTINVKYKNIIPISAKIGDNVTSKSKQMNWYRDQTVIQALDSYELLNLEHKLPLRFPIQDIYKFDDKRIIVGRIESGKLKKNDKLLSSPNNVSVTVQSIEKWKKKPSSLLAGECAGITLTDHTFLEKGNVLSHIEEAPFLVNTFEANIFWFSKKRLRINKKYFLKINAAIHEIFVKKIINVTNTEDLSIKKSNIVGQNDVAEIVIHSPSLISIDNFDENPRTGRFTILEDYEIVGGGIAKLKNYLNQRDSVINERKNIFQVNFEVSEVDRTLRSGHRPGIIWLTGLSGAGKTSIAKEIEKRLFTKGYNVYVLDGDNLRHGLNKDLSFTPRERMENIRRTSEVASLFSRAGFIVIVALISPYQSERNKARSIRPEIFREIFIKASIKECMKRDTKGLYLKAKKGEIKNFTGITAPYEEPSNPDLTLDTTNSSIDKNASELEDFITKQFGK